MFTVYLHSTIVVDEQGTVKSIKKEKPLIIFKGAADGPVARSIAASAGNRAGLHFVSND